MFGFTLSAPVIPFSSDAGKGDMSGIVKVSGVSAVGDEATVDKSDGDQSAYSLGLVVSPSMS